MTLTSVNTSAFLVLVKNHNLCGHSATEVGLTKGQDTDTVIWDTSGRWLYKFTGACHKGRFNCWFQTVTGRFLKSCGWDCINRLNHWAWTHAGRKILNFLTFGRYHEVQVSFPQLIRCPNYIHTLTVSPYYPSTFSLYCLPDPLNVFLPHWSLQVRPAQSQVSTVILTNSWFQVSDRWPFWPITKYD